MSKDSSVKISRRTVIRAGLAAGAAGFTGRAHAQQKIAKEQVMYQDHPKNGKRCDQCIQWQPPDACKIVAGKISPQGWCGVFAPKA